MHVAEFSSLIISSNLLGIHSKEAVGVGTNRIWSMCRLGSSRKSSWESKVPPRRTPHPCPYWGREEFFSMETEHVWSELSLHGSCMASVKFSYESYSGDLMSIFLTAAFLWLPKVHVIWQTRAVSLHIFAGYRACMNRLPKKNEPNG